ELRVDVHRRQREAWRGVRDAERPSDLRSRLRRVRPPALGEPADRVGGEVLPGHGASTATVSCGELLAFLIGARSGAGDHADLPAGPVGEREQDIAVRSDEVTG